MTRDEILAAFDRIRVWQQGDRRAVHKPLLVLLALGRLLRGEAPLVEFAGGPAGETAAGVRPLRLGEDAAQSVLAPAHRRCLAA